jgi:hypothetical protein
MGFEQLVSRAPLLGSGVLPRASRLNEWLRFFDPEFYGSHGHLSGVADLSDMSRAELINHFVYRGWREGRSYSRFLHSFIDPAYYRSAYPELGLSTDAAAVRHWVYDGYFEGRVPNRTTRQMLDSEFHVFQFGKVGSKAVERALYAAGHPGLVLHVHWAADLVLNYPDCPLSYPELVNADRDKPIRFITGVRDPLDRLVSGYFQSNLESRVKHGLDVSPNIVIGEIMSMVDDGQLDAILDWFDHQFFRGIDVYSEPFDVDQGFRTLGQGGARVFLYRVDHLPRLTMPLAEFTGLPVQLVPTNCAADKDYAGLYHTILGILRFPAAVVDRVLKSALVRHFFSAGEIDRMRTRWTTGIPPGAAQKLGSSLARPDRSST